MKRTLILVFIYETNFRKFDQIKNAGLSLRS